MNENTTDSTPSLDGGIASSFCCGFIALVGRPNSGKSTLLNTILGEQLSIVTPLPQTTRQNMRGIHSDQKCQIIFVDTPGVHMGDHALNQGMVAQSKASLKRGECDAVLYIVDLTRPFGPEEDTVAQMVLASKAPVVVVFNKLDHSADPDVVRCEFFRRYPLLATSKVLTLSALDLDAKEIVLAAVRPLLRPSPPLFPIDELTDSNLRHFAAEYLRKQIIHNTREEVPHACFVEILQYKELADLHEIEAVIHVETQGQKSIVVGSGAAVLKQIRTFAQKDMRRLTGIRTKINCHVVVTPHWRDDPRFLREMGYSI